MLNNNIAACYCKLNDLQRADKFNNLALIEDPEYAKAFYRRCLIHEEQGKFTLAANMADWSIKRFDSEFEEQDNRQIVPLFAELRARCQESIPFEEQVKEKNLDAEVEQEM